MKKIGYFRKISLYWNFRKVLKKLSEELKNNFNARIDAASRIYTVINLPPELIEEPYNLRKEDIDLLAKKYIKEYSTKLSGYLNSKNLIELYDFYDVKKVDKYSYLLIFGFSLFDSAKFMRNFYISLFSISFVLLIILLVLIF